MNQEAIKLNRNNAQTIAEQLSDSWTGQDLLDECNYMLNANINVVFVRNVFPDGMKLYSHIVSESMFYANARPVSPLNDSTFVEVEQL